MCSSASEYGVSTPWPGSAFEQVEVVQESAARQSASSKLQHRIRADDGGSGAIYRWGTDAAVA